jgi:Dolichyl-phosphate-mannose-protein mannosyltransferase
LNRLRIADSGATVVAVALAAVTFYAGLHFGSTTAGGADSYGYVSEAGQFLNGQLTIQHDIIRQSPWPNAAETWAPLGYRPSPKRPDAIVPLYAPGLPLLMAAAQRIGGFCAAFFIVPLCGALTVWLTFVLARQLLDSMTGAIGVAILVATSPVFLYQLMNPMSDVPVTAAWTLALLASVNGWPIAAGVASGVALLIRPNLAAVALALLGWLMLTRQKPLRFLLALGPFAGVIAVINASLYESFAISGYGTLGELYSWSYFATNVRQFARWTFETQTAIVVIAVLYFVVPRIVRPSRVPYPRVLLIAVGGAITLSYLFYQPFDAWWYLRFLLPAWPIVMVATVAGVVAVAERLVKPFGLTVALLAVGLLAVNGLRIAAMRFAFDVGRGERRYVDVARFVEANTDRRAVIFALQHSGTIRLYAGRLTLRFDQLDPAWFDRAVEFLAASGRHPYIVVQGDEAPAFKARFAASAIGRLEQSPIAQLNGGEVNIYDASAVDRDASPLAIAATASRRTGWRCDLPYRWPPPTRID